jgi:NDP-sugar pyrophosphorylase family protein
MKKEKIAISIDKDILGAVDSSIDGTLIRSRSQAIEAILSRGLKATIVDTAVILLHPRHISVALKNMDDASLIRKQIDFLKRNWIRDVKIATGISNDVESLIEEIRGEESVEIVQKDCDGNGDALFSLRDNLPDNFVVMSGDVFNDFSIQGMIKDHIDKGKLVTMGLMTKEKNAKYGTAVLDGSLIVEFSEKPKSASTYVVNAGIYLFKKEAFNLFDEKTKSLENDLFPRLARIRQLQGYFTKGKYVHMG